VIESGLEVLESIERIAQRLGLSTSMAKARIEERTAAPREARALGLEGDGAVTAVTRVIAADGQRVAHLVDVVPQQVLRGEELRGYALPLRPGLATSSSTHADGFHGSVLDYLRARRRQIPSWRRRWAFQEVHRCSRWRHNCMPRTVRWWTTRSAGSCRGTSGFM
jgi:hypothetical protein